MQGAVRAAVGRAGDEQLPVLLADGDVAVHALAELALGPVDAHDSGSMETVTPAGTGIGLRPMRDITLTRPSRRPRRPRPRGARRGRSSLRGTWRRSPCPCRPGPWGSRRRRRSARPGRDTRCSPEIADGGSSVYFRRTTMTSPGCSAVGASTVVAVDVALLGEDAGHLDLELARGDLDGLARGVDRVADPREEVGDGVGHGHGATSSLFVIPGM